MVADHRPDRGDNGGKSTLRVKTHCQKGGTDLKNLNQTKPNERKTKNKRKTYKPASPQRHNGHTE